MYAVFADLPFRWSFPQECTTFNVSWKPDNNAFPYSVYLMSMSANVQSWRIDSDYQPNASEITFQYQLQQFSDVFQSFMVAVVDSKGNGNSSTVLAPKRMQNRPLNCSVYAESNAWTYASDLAEKEKGASSEDRLQCGFLNYYPVDNLSGTGPFSYSLIPELSKPITVNIPASSQKNKTYFNYEGIVPFAQGTRFYQFMSDSTRAGSGGGSPLYTVGPSKNTSCLQNGYKIQNLDTIHALPVGSFIAYFQNLPGAINYPNSELGNNTTPGNQPKPNVDDHKGTQDNNKNFGPLIGGILGALFGFLLLAFIFYRWRNSVQEKKHKNDRMERPQFVDLWDNTFEQDQSGVRQSTLISPFISEPNGVYQSDRFTDNSSIGLLPISRNHTSSILNSSLNSQSRTALLQSSRSEATLQKSRSNYGLSMGEMASSALEGLLHDSCQNSVTQADPRQQHRQNVSEVDNDHQVRYASMYSTTSNPISMDGVQTENELLSGETNMNWMNSSSSVPYTLNGSAEVTEDGISSSARPYTALRRSNNKEAQRQSSQFVEHFDAGPIVEDCPPAYQTWLNQTASSKS